MTSRCHIDLSRFAMCHCVTPIFGTWEVGPSSLAWIPRTVGWCWKPPKVRLWQLLRGSHGQLLHSQHCHCYVSGLWRVWRGIDWVFPHPRRKQQKANRGIAQARWTVAEFLCAIYNFCQPRYSVFHKPPNTSGSDPFHQFAWLRRKLTEAARDKRKVWIAGHSAANRRNSLVLRVLSFFCGWSASRSG